MPVPLGEFVEGLRAVLLSLAPRINELVLQSPRAEQSTLADWGICERLEPLDSPLLRVAEPPKGRMACSCVDSSSRSVGFRGLRLFVGAAVLTTPAGLSSVPGPAVDAPFVAAKSYSPVLVELESAAESAGLPVAVRSPAGYLYAEEEGYKDDNINDELRLSLEQRALEEAVSSGADYVLVDGPVVPTPPVLLSPSGESKYREAFEELILSARGRARLVSSSPTPVLGLVKRCNASRKLARCREVAALLESLGYGASLSAPDSVVVDAIARAFYRERVSPARAPIVMGPLEADYGGRLPAKVMWYVWAPSPAGPAVFRLEALREHADRLSGDVELAASLTIAESWPSGLPAKLMAVDRLARRLSRALYLRLAGELSPFLALTYDEAARLAEARWAA